MNEERIFRAAAAAEQLCAALWEAVHDELNAGRTQQVLALTERIAEVCGSVPAVACTDRDRGAEPAAVEDAFEPAHERRVVRRSSELPTEPLEAGSVDDGAVRGAAVDSERWSLATRPAKLVDEHEGLDRSIAVKDVRGCREGAWIAAVQRRLERYAEDREPFAVLLLELLEAEQGRLVRARASNPQAIREAESAIIEQLRPADALMRERDGRYWLIAPQTDSAGARALGELLCTAVRRLHLSADGIVEVALGVASCPEHGLDASVLTAHADIDLYAAEGSSPPARGNGARPIR